MSILVQTIGMFLTTGAVMAAPTANIKDFQLQCTGMAVLESTSNAQYHEGKPPSGRFPGFPPRSTFTALVRVTELSSGCAPLQAKYDLHVNGFSFSAHFGTLPVLSLSEVHNAAEQAVGMKMPITLHQSFGY